MSVTAPKQKPASRDRLLEEAGRLQKAADVMLHAAVLQEHQRLMLAARVGGLGV